MSFFRISSVAFFASMYFALCAPVRAAGTIEFRFGGVFTHAINSVHQVGQPFTSTLIFDPTAVDINPSPLRGSYGFIRWTAPSTNDPIVFQNEDGTTAGIRVRRDFDSSEAWELEFQGGPADFIWRISLIFPVGTFPTDALPQTLPFSQSTTRRFIASNGGQNLQLEGTITSLTVIPEPTSAGAFGLLGWSCRRRRHHCAPVSK